MQNFCISLPRPGPRLRAVIVIIIYVMVSRFAPGDTAPMAAGSILALAATWSAPDTAAPTHRGVIR